MCCKFKEIIIFSVICIIFISGIAFVKLSQSNFERNDSRFESAMESTADSAPIEILIPNVEKSSHSSAILDLDSRLMILYFAGDREGARNVKIYQTFVDKDSATTIENTSFISTPQPILDATMLSKMSGKFSL